jgi:hypothetical protein
VPGVATAGLAAGAESPQPESKSFMTGAGGAGADLKDGAETCGGGAALVGAGAGESGVAQASLLPHASILLMPEKLEDCTAAGLAADGCVG